MASPFSAHPTSFYPRHQHKIRFALKKDFLDCAYALYNFLLSCNVFRGMQIKLHEYTCSICDSSLFTLYTEQPCCLAYLDNV